MTRVYVGNLGKNGSRRELEREFERFGPLRDVWVARNPPGFAFVLFEDARDAEDACHDMDGRYICGEKIRVEMARGPNRGGRASRMGLKEKCYECGRVGHFARACTRRPGNYSRDRGDRRRRSRSRSPRSRSRSPRRRRSESRSPSPRRRSRSNEDKKSKSRSKSHSKSRSRSRSQSKERADKERRSTSPDRKHEKEKEEDITDPKETKKEEETEKPAANDPETKSRSVSPAPNNDEDDDNLSKEDNAE